MQIISFILIYFIFPVSLMGMKIDRVILSSDTNQNYLPYWPIVAKAWKKLGIKPTLALIGKIDVEVDRSLGDVIRFDPILHVKTSLQAQTIRFFLPAMFPEEVCLISDIDLLPLNKEYFFDAVKDLPEDAFIVYRDKAYKNMPRYPMCFIAAKGKTFQEVFEIKKIRNIPFTIKKWKKLKLGWNTDELLLYRYLINWKDFDERCILLHHDVEKRIDRMDWKYDEKLVKENYYIDAHLPRPYSEHKEIIDQFISHLDLEK